MYVNGQQSPEKCGHDYVIQQVDSIYGNHNEMRSTFLEQAEQFQQTNGTPEATLYTIPVVVHIIYNDETSNITRDQVLDAIKHLNIDYRRQNSDTSNTRAIFKSRAADIEVQFALAKLDPNGNCTDGITRTFSNLTDGASNNVKSLVNWNNKKYLNIWVVKSITLQGVSNVLGFAAFPISGGNPGGSDGIVIRHDNFGTIGTAIDPDLGDYQAGRTLTHESGHYLGLYHTFQGGCFGQGDGVSDTPPVDEANFGCNLGVNSCTNDVPDLPDMIENYMDYADGTCMNMFTTIQKNIMRFTLSSSQYRNELITSTTATATGIAANQTLPCLPMPDFTSDNNLICEGGSVQFMDLTYMGNPTSYQWTFTGGNPATSTQQNPIVTYAQKGNYKVELSTTNAVGTTSLIYKGYVSVRSQTNTPNVNTFGDDFELYPIPNENWHVEAGIDTNDFRYFTKTAYAGQSCVTLQNFYGVKGERDEMISHAIDVSNSKTVDLRFNYAFAERANGNNDKLQIWVSDDCGQTWVQKGNQQGPLLRTVGAKIDTAWWPTQASEWRLRTQNLDDYALSPNYILIKFVFEHGSGNNFYLDDVQIATTIGVENLFTNEAIRVYPNPASEVVKVQLENQDAATVQMLDVTGRVVAEKITTSGETEINTASLAQGMYIIRVHQNGTVSNHKIIVN